MRKPSSSSSIYRPVPTFNLTRAVFGGVGMVTTMFVANSLGLKFAIACNRGMCCKEEHSHQ